MAKSFYEQKCRICGCDWNHACNDHDYWFAEDICSACAEKMKPILFNTPMVQAILDGRKTTTRRPVKNLAIFDNGDGYFTAKEIHKGEITEYLNETFGGSYDFVVGNAIQYARYQKGDILYVRETWGTQPSGEYIYKCGYIEPITGSPDCNYLGHKILWHPSIFMPKEAARIFLRVTDAKAERLRDIDKYWSNYDKEGMRDPKTESISIAMQEKFISIWDRTIKKSDLDKYGWDANPWVWFYQFERIGEKTA